jgi:hypothetical protein
MKNEITSKACILRKKAEELLQNKAAASSQQPAAGNQPINPSESEVLKLIHQLEVHQIELEMQNEELILAKELAEVAANKYTDLYDFAPLSYFTLSKEGRIIELNFSGAKLLCIERSKLIDFPFGVFVSDDTKLIFNHFLENIQQQNKRILRCDLVSK